MKNGDDAFAVVITVAWTARPDGDDYERYSPPISTFSIIHDFFFSPLLLFFLLCCFLDLAVFLEGFDANLMGFMLMSHGRGNIVFWQSTGNHVSCYCFFIELWAQSTPSPS